MTDDQCVARAGGKSLRRRLYIAAKAPRIGVAKTRLGRVLGAAEAVDLYRAFLVDIGSRFAAAPFPVSWFVTPADAWSELASIVGSHARDQQVLVQGAGDWTERQRQLFRGAAERGDEQAILIASDSPHTTVDIVAEAFRILEQHDVVIGPVYDGGYYLLGMRGWHDILRGIPMSTATVVEAITERAHELGLTVGQVETTFDIDEVTDLPHLQRLALARDDLPATRAALARLGLVESPAQHDARPNGADEERKC